MSSKNFLLLIDVTEAYNTDKLKEKLNKCIDWLRIVPGCYFLRSTSDKNKLYARFKPVLNNVSFFIIELKNKNDYTGWLPRSKWTWMKQYNKN